METSEFLTKSNKVWNVALYIRLSREDGDKLESESVTSQKEMLHNFLSHNPDLQIYDTYIDDGYTGTNFERPNFMRMWEDVQNKKVNCVIVKDLSRFGRDHIGTSRYIEIVFPMLNVRFISINDNIDSFLDPKSVNNVVLPFKNLINDEYCRDISMKVRSALNIRRENGKYIGSFATYGYLKDPEDHHKLIIDEYAADVVRKIFRMYLDGGSLRSIATYLNENKILTPSAYKRSLGLNDRHHTTHDLLIWEGNQIRRILSNQMYCGDMVQKQMEVVSYKVNICRKMDKDKRIIVQNTHEPIISREDFEKAQSLSRRDTRVCLTTHQLDLFSGFVKCGDCKRGMNKRHIYQPYKDYYYYVCRTWKQSGKTVCSKHTIQTDIVKNVVLETIKQYVNIAITMDSLLDFINHSEEKCKATDKYEKQLQQKFKERDKNSKIMVDLYPDWKNGLISQEMYVTLRDKYTNENLKIEQSIQEIQEMIEQIKSGLTKENRFIENFKKYQNITELTRDMVVELINNIYVYEGNKVEVEVKFKDEYELALEYIELNKKIYIAEQRFKNAQVAVV